MENTPNNELLDRWEIAISLYFKSFKWAEVAKEMKMNVRQIYHWRCNKEFKKLFNAEKDKIFEENNDCLRSFSEEINIHLIGLAEQDEDLNIKLQAIKEFNRRVEKIEDDRSLREAKEALEEIRDAHRSSSN